MLAKTNSERKGFTWLQVTAHHRGKPKRKRNSGQELDAETLEECCLLFAPSTLLSFFSYRAQAHWPMNGTTHTVLGSPMSISSQGNAPQTCPAGQYNGGSSSTESPSSLVCLVLCRVVIEYNNLLLKVYNSIKQKECC